jgi:hypothetical protein
LQGVPVSCGKADEPTTLIVTDRAPALGATVKNSDITEGFTLRHASVLTDAIALDATSPLHTAGFAMSAYTVTPPLSYAGTPGRFDRTVGSWSTAPGHVELSAVAGYRTEDGCYYQLPSPLFSYDVTP